MTAMPAEAPDPGTRFEPITDPLHCVGAIRENGRAADRYSTCEGGDLGRGRRARWLHRDRPLCGTCKRITEQAILAEARTAEQPASTKPPRPYVIRRIGADGDLVDRTTGTVIGHVGSNYYGWCASTEWTEHRMHGTRDQAAQAAWSEWKRRTEGAPDDRGK